ncbi:serine--tRNA ligase [Candidatus Microgenomates bacterium]|nr:serine--tRNA ligase [Candidatus Microgenomates bacterium]
MLDIKYIRENKERVKENCKNRRVNVDIEKILHLDERRRELTTQIDELRAQRNKKSKEKPNQEEIELMRKVGEQIKDLEKELESIEENYKKLLLSVPNLTHPDAPIGGEEDFKILEKKGHITEFSFEPKDHEILAKNLDLLDFERGAKTSAAKFYFVKNDLVRLNQALINYGIDIATNHNYILMETPDIAKNNILSGIGFNPRGEETQVYSLENTDLSLIGTAEITIGGYHADEILDLSKSAKKYVALSHCFRTEAGAYGRTSKGLYRVHQFTKLEMFVFCKPEDSEKYHQEILNIEKEICEGLKLPYRVIDIASGDLGSPAYRKFDIEAWMTMNKDYGEITSTSNCTDYQSRRLNIRYRTDGGKTEFVHTLNGTAIVTSRFPIAILENNQQADGSIKVPEVLQKWVGKEVIKAQ